MQTIFEIIATKRGVGEFQETLARCTQESCWRERGEVVVATLFTVLKVITDIFQCMTLAAAAFGQQLLLSNKSNKPFTLQATIKCNGGRVRRSCVGFAAPSKVNAMFLRLSASHHALSHVYHTNKQNRKIETATESDHVTFS